MKRIEKLAMLERILAGDKQPLHTFRRQRGRRYTPQEQAAQQAYLSEVWGKPATPEETETFFGLYDKSGVPGATAYQLPNNMFLFF